MSGLPEEAKHYSQGSIGMRETESNIYYWIDGKDYDELRAAAEKLMAENEALRKFAQRVMDDWPDGSNMDGGELQDIAHECGLLKDIIRTESCGDNCGCAEYYSDEEFAEGVTCYTRTALLTGNAMQASAAEKDEK